VINTLPITIPPCPWDHVNDTARIEINEGLKIYATQCLHSPVVDLSNVWKGDDEKTYWSSDMVHFSAKGYDAIAEKISDTLKHWTETGSKPIINQSPTAAKGKEFKVSNKDVATALLSVVREKKVFAPDLSC
jgi:hypothetical protein